ncbi:hypothetical protein DH2020_020716 [Rehmannia glutinosa]|uniref:Uncharacterized protein n=1 Tax=Rehmannia glutinosa TaxID=99300 RepID=A0ABR0WKJ9_REHGL
MVWLPPTSVSVWVALGHSGLGPTPKEGDAFRCISYEGEYHLDLIVSYGAAPIIIPRVKGIHKLLDSFEPIHGVLLCEGEDIDPSLYDSELSNLSQEELEEIKKLHSSDTSIDHEKDLIELKLVKLCLERNIPYLGICRGSQILNVACGGTLYQDIEKEFSKKSENNNYKVVNHMDYENYDGHRHVVSVVENTPLHEWFRDSLEVGRGVIFVNSYHHQGVKRLAQRFVPMAFAPDGLVEGFYDPSGYNPEEGKFIMGLQFHPERMRNHESGGFDYPGCASAYQEFVKAVIAYEKKLSGAMNVANGPKIVQNLEKKRKSIVPSFSIARNIYSAGHENVSESELEATVINASLYINRLKMNQEREKAARVMMGKMSIEQLSDMATDIQLDGSRSQLLSVFSSGKWRARSDICED